MNDRPVACQTRGPTDPQGDRCPHIPAASAATNPLRRFAPQWARFDNRHSTSVPAPTLAVVSGSGAGIVSRPGASAFFVSDGDSFAPAGSVPPIPRRRQPLPTHCGAPRRNGRDLIIAIRSAHPILPSHCISGSGAGIVSRPGASAFFVSDGPISSNSGRNGGKNAGRNCVSALPQRAMPVRCRPRFPSRNRRFPDRCRSPDCASTAFRCRCLLLR